MAFPNLDNNRSTQGLTATTAPVIDLPTSGIASGSLLLVLFYSAAAGAVGWPTGWTELVDASPHAADDQIAIAWKVADGSENGTSITLSSGNGRFIGVAFAISGAADPSIQPPEISTAATGSATDPDAPNFTPTGGAKDYLWIAAFGMEGEGVFSSHPTNYSFSAGTNSGTAGGAASNCVGALAGRKLNAASENPGPWSYSSGEDDWVAYTIAIHPVEVRVRQPQPTRLNQAVNRSLTY